jgi:hypothetical protein
VSYNLGKQIRADRECESTRRGVEAGTAEVKVAWHTCEAYEAKRNSGTAVITKSMPMGDRLEHMAIIAKRRMGQGF